MARRWGEGRRNGDDDWKMRGSVQIGEGRGLERSQERVKSIRQWVQVKQERNMSGKKKNAIHLKFRFQQKLKPA